MPIYAEQHAITHYAFIPADPDLEPDSHGNREGELSPTGVPRRAIAIYPMGGGSRSTEPITNEQEARNHAFLNMLVKHPEVYGDQDEVEIGGRRFEVKADGRDADWRRGHLPAKYSRVFGGQVPLRRVG